MNKRWIAVAMLAAAAIAAPARAEEAPKKPLTAQQQKMKDCNAEAKAKTLKGQERKDFMKICLSGGNGAAKKKPAAEEGAKQAEQQARMKSCNAEAKEKGLKGQERKEFMKTCLSG